MTHRLAQRHPMNAIGDNPLNVSLRYRCECTGGEVINIQMMLDNYVDEDRFVAAVRQMWRDMQTEIQQHLKPARAVA